jgi:23S rRNA (adenine2503-C2)-methyltransferase
LIPYNPIAGLDFKKPSASKVRAFQDVLEKAHIPTTCRYTKGDDIAAACGQLAMKDL